MKSRQETKAQSRASCVGEWGRVVSRIEEKLPEKNVQPVMPLSKPPLVRSWVGVVLVGAGVTVDGTLVAVGAGVLVLVAVGTEVAVGAGTLVPVGGTEVLVAVGTAVLVAVG